MTRSALLCAVVLAAVGPACSAARGPGPAVPAGREEPAAGERSEGEPAPESRADAPPHHEEPAALDVPTACADPKAEICTPPAQFVEQVCLRGTPGIAFAMFRKGTPWQRRYLRLDTEAWYAGGGMSHRTKLRRNEEVLVLASRNGETGGVQVVGAGSYDVFRWDGTCVTVQTDEVTPRKIGLARVAPLRWRRIEEDFRAVLLEDEGIAYRNRMRRKLCTSSKSASRPCKQNQVALNRLIADYVRKGGALPVPKLRIR